MRPNNALLAALACAALLVAAAQASTLPNPFTIKARWSAASLGLNDPFHLGVGPSGNIYVTDRSQRVTELSSSGKVLRRFGKPGSGRGEFHFISYDPTTPTQIASEVAVGPDGKVYVTDSGNGRIEVFTSSGKFLRQIGSFGSGKTQFLRPDELVVDGSSNVYVVDGGQQSVRKFSPTGKLLWMVNTKANADRDLVGGFHATMVDSHGRLVGTNDANGRVVILDTSTGHKVDAFGKPSDFPNLACSASVDSAGYTYVNGCGMGANVAATEVFNPAHDLVGRWTPSPLVSSPTFGPRGEIVAIAWQGTKQRGGSIVKLAISHL
jgi:DNA-binding beta-propeller fold protein YncE